MAYGGAAESELSDITPKENGATAILFVPDHARAYDFEEHRRFDNIRQALKDDPLIGEFFAAKRRVFEYEEGHSSGTGLLMSFNQLEYLALRAAADEKLIDLLKWYLRPDDPCFCNSGAARVDMCHGMEALQKQLKIPR